jgi:YVTN family beta-propeller protein
VQAAAVEVLALDPFRALGSVRTGPVPTRVVFNRAGNLAYVTSQFAEEIGIVELERLSQVSAISVPGHPMAAALSIDGRTLYVTTNLDHLCAVSLATGRVACSIPVPQICTELAVDPSGHRLYVPTWRAGTILEVDAHTLHVLRRFEVGGKVQGLALPSDGATLFAANEGGWLDVIHVHSGRRITRLDFGSTAFGVAISPDEAVVYVSLLGSGLVVIVDRPTLSVRTSLHLGGKPRRITFDASGRLAVIANEQGWVDLVE